MRLLLDTQVFIWLIAGSPRLSRTAADLLAAPENRLYFSHASIWEMQIKFQLGKLPLDADPVTGARHAADQGFCELLPIALDHVAGLAELPAVHRDPFDRMLVSQARAEGLTLVTADADIPRYPVPTLWR